MREKSPRNSGMEAVAHLEGLDRFRAVLEIQQTHSPSNTTKMLISTLSQLEKSGLVTQESFEMKMADRRALVAEFVRHLDQKGNKDIRTPKARLHSLIDAYQRQEESFDNLSFADTLRKVVHNHYGELTGSSGKYPSGLTLAHVARDVFAFLVEEGLEAPREPQQMKNWEDNFRSWYRGKNEPARLKYEQHILAMERFFRLPERGLWGKLAEDSVDFNARFHTPRYRRSRQFLRGPLPAKIAAHLDQYAEFKLSGKQPKILQYPLHLHNDVARRRFFHISNKSRRNGGGWTQDGAGRCKSKEGMSATWGSYLSYLYYEHEWADEPPALAEYELNLFADDVALESFVELIVENGIGHQTASRFLNFVESNAHQGGYFRHCVAPPRGMSTPEWFDQMDNLLDFIPRLHERLRRASKLRSNPAIRHFEDAKRNIRFLLQLDTDSAHAELDRMSTEAFRVAGRNNRRSSRMRSMTFAWTGMLLKVMLVVPLRAANWSAMRYFPSQSDDDLQMPSIVYIESADRYRIWVPKSYLKNREGKNVQPIEILLPSAFNAPIQLYLKYRHRYIKHRYEGDPADIQFFGVSCWRTNEPLQQMTPGNVSGRFSQVTYSLIKRLYPKRDHIGINMHAMRHLAATLYLRENPREYPTVATLLNDTLEMVISTYAELDAYHNNERIIDWVTAREAKLGQKRQRR